MATIKIMTREEWQKQYGYYVQVDPSLYEDLMTFHGLTKEQVDKELYQALEQEYQFYVAEQVRRIRSIFCEI